MKGWKASAFGRLRSFQARLLLLATATSAVAALLVCGTLVVLHQLGIRALVVEQLESQGEVVAFNAVATLAFDQPDEAVEVLASLRGVEQVAAAYLFSSDGRLFASRELMTGRTLPAVAALAPGLYTQDSWLVQHTPVMVDGQRLGSLALVYDRSWMQRRMWLNVAAALLITALATVAASLLARRLQRALAVPVNELIGTSRRVSETGDYSLRAHHYDNDELGELTDAFNSMLTRIDQQAGEVRRVHSQFEVAVEASPQGMAMVDAEGRIVLVNRMMEELFGYARAELVGQPIEMLVPAASRRPHHEYRRQFQLAPRKRAMGADRDLNGVRRDGSEFPVEIGLNPIQTERGLRVLISVVDITERKRAAEALRDRERRLHTLTNAVPAFVWRSDSEGKVLEINQRWYEYTGAAPDQPVDQSRANAIHPEDRQRTEKLWREARAAESPWEGEMRILRHDGTYRWFLGRAVPMRDDSGALTGWFGTTTDIEDRKRAETQRDELLRSEREARREAERTSRVKDEFVATLSHELRTPVAAILGWTYVLRKEAGENAALLDGLDTIERNARAQTQLIEDLLDVSRIVSGKIRLDVQLVELPDVIEAAIETVRPAAQSKGIRLQKIIDSRVTPVHGDFGRLQQIVWNLLSNAVKFTPKDGRVQVTLQRINSHLEISVSDTGEGIEPEFLPHLFERFSQADASSSRTHSGLGIGLALVKHLTELHGGTVRASSGGRGQGATFTVELPLAIMPRQDEFDEERMHPTAGLRPPAIESSDLQDVKVMVVEDERDARHFIVRLLEDARATVRAAASASAALLEMATFMPDVIVSDIGLPQMDGYAFMHELRQRPAADGGRIPALALTAFARAEDRTRALRSGYQMHVAKPVEPAELLAAIASLASLKARQKPGT
jgi:PAS domain S-box-containing protein